MEGSGRLRWDMRVATNVALCLTWLLVATAVPAKCSTLFPALANQNDATNCLASLPAAAFQDQPPGGPSLSNIFKHLLPNILIERVSGTAGNLLVREFIKREMSTLGWLVEEDLFRDSTPYGGVTFSNIVATLNPAATKRVVIACHYDSKYIPGEEPFVGASDSAVPCSVMMDTARLFSHLAKISPDYEDRDITLQLVFLDGEEAYVQWTSTDSLYGSRHLADLWEHLPDPNDPTAANYLVNIHFFILLDLIGTSDTRFVNCYTNTSKLFQQLVSIEQCLTVNDLMTRRSPGPIFSPHGRSGVMEDDHIPFIRRGVPVLHLISTPFPRVWHTADDNLKSLDIGLINDFSKIFHIFLLSVLYDV